MQSALRQAKADENAKTPMQVFRDENAKTPLQVFRDENAGMGRNAKENAIVPGVAKVNNLPWHVTRLFRNTPLVLSLHGSFRAITNPQSGARTAASPYR